MVSNAAGPNDSATSFGMWLRHRREALHLTRGELAERAGCSISTLRKLEDDERRPSPAMAESLAVALLVDSADRQRFVDVARRQRSFAHLETFSPLSSPQPSLPLPNLPISTTALVGRAQEVETVLNLLYQLDCRLVTVLGPGGIGKSRLSLAVADAGRAHFAEGVFFVPLAAVSDHELVEGALIQHLGIHPDESVPRRNQLIAALQDRRLLLVLDNVEHLPGIAELLTDLLTHAAGFAVLATSRTRLHLAGEWVFELDGLSSPPVEAERLPPAALLRFDAPRLFVDAARRTRFDFVPSPADIKSIVRICRMVEGMPLALELAATWIDTLTCADIAAEIATNLDFLSAPLRDLPARHRNMRAVFDHSWRLLGSEEQTVLRQLFVFRAPFTREAAAAIAGASLTHLGDLIAKSLLRRAGNARYDLHELVRQYAGEQLAAAQETTAAVTRYIDFYLGLAEEAAPFLDGPEQRTWLSRLEDEHNHMRAVLQWLWKRQESEKGLHLALALTRFWEIRAHPVEGYHWLTRLLDGAGDLCPSPLRASAQLAAGRLAHKVHGSETARAWFAATVDLFRQVGDRAGEAAALLGLGNSTEDHTIAREFYDRSLALARTEQHQRGTADALYALGSLASGDGDHEQADGLYTQALAIVRQLGNSLGEAATLRALAVGAFRQGAYERAEALYSQALEHHRSLNATDGISVSLNDLGDVALARGDLRAAATLYGEGLEYAWHAQNRWLIAWGFEGLAHTAASQGRSERAVRLFSCATALFEAMGTRLRPDDRQDRDRRLEILRAKLGQPDFRVLWIEGAAFPLDAAFHYAMEDA